MVLADRRGKRRAVRTIVELEEQTSVGEALVRSLVRAQLRTALLLTLTTLGTIGILPLLFFWLPELGAWTVGDVKISWILLGAAPFPAMLVVGLVYQWRAERHERDFIDMVEN